MVDWSRELLDPSDRALVQRLAVVPAPFTAETAVAVSGAHPADVRRGLATLVEQSLLTLDEDDDGPARYRMLETVREYGEVRLDVAGERPAAMDGLVALGGGRPPSGSARTSSAPGSWSRSTAAPRSRRPSSPPCGGPSTTTTRPVRSTSRAPCSTSGASAGCTSSASSGRCGSCTPTTRPRDGRRPCSSGAAAGRALPDADRVTTACVFAAVNAGVATSQRPVALAWRAIRRVLADRPAQVSPRMRALAATLPALGSPDVDESLAAAAADGRGGRRRSSRASGCSCGPRSGRTRATRRRPAPTRARRTAGSRPSATTGAWGWPRRASASGRARAAAATPRGGCCESLEHLELVGAMQDVRSLRVQLDLQRALGGRRGRPRRSCAR